jgi:flagellar motility protein MotE (MotC chaperone)
MIKLLTSPWTSVPVGALLYLGSMLLFWKTPQPAVVDAGGAAATVSGPSWNFTSPEADQLITELKSEKGALGLRKQQLDELASRLGMEREEMAAASNAVRKLQEDFDKSVTRVQEEEVPNLKKLAKVYSGMTPDAAATVMGRLDDAVVVKVMLYMKESETGAILETLAKKGPGEAKRVADISERLRLAIPAKTPPAK